MEREDEGGPALSLALPRPVRISCAVLSALVALMPAQAQPYRQDLRENWALQSACKIKVGGDVVSTTQFTPEHWYKTAVPSTVMAAQGASGEFPDLFYSDNLRKLKLKGDPCGCSWWFRTESRLPAGFQGRQTWLHLSDFVSDQRKNLA